MARVRVPSLVVSFPTTAAAMACEECCRRRGLPGRMIPLPGEVSAGCGLAWKAAPAARDELAAALEADDVPVEGWSVVELLEFVR
ncbi:DUF3343 domain-containing protein [Olsenella profusa]|uniref:DUF3343 domain-containing protein n=1 Tax=Olsenella profusa TaxID=138595 RepID=A0ABS2F486_9ACTN|nr:DUF3343 domain-containing protein [Olsenella profusa]MBM6775645.1 DUF3343 domain-containing protein [Olsenella profusa]